MFLFSELRQAQFVVPVNEGIERVCYQSSFCAGNESMIATLGSLSLSITSSL